MLILSATAGQTMSKQNLGAPGVTLAWDSNPDTNTVGYHILYGTTSGSYTTKIDAGNANTLVVSGLVPGPTYYFAATSYDAFGDESLPSNETTFNQRNFSLPVITSQPASGTNAAGATATFTVNATGADPLNYQWLKNGTPLSAATSATLTLVNVADSDAAGYAVVITNAVGSATSSNATLSVLDAPTINGQPVGLTNLAGTTAIFTVTAGGASPLSFQWVKDGTNTLGDGDGISGSSTASLTLSNVLGAAAANYAVVISNAAGTVTSGPAPLAVIDPIITNQPVSVAGNAGATIEFSVGAYGTSPAYQWLKGAIPINGATNATLSLANISDADTGDYSVIVSNEFGSVTSSVAGLNVIDSQTPLTIVTQPVSITSIAGSTAIFTVGATGNPPLSYQWLKNSLPISGATDATLTLANVADADAAGYRVVVSDDSGSIYSLPAALSVLDPPVITSQPASMVQNAGSAAQFSVEVSGVTPGYQWFKGVIPIPGATNATLALANVTATDAGPYSVIVSNAFGHVTSSAATLGVVPITAPVPPALTPSLTPGVPTRLSLTVVAGCSYELQATSDLKSWTTIWQLNPATNSSLVEVEDAGAGALPMRFYRLLLH